MLGRAHLRLEAHVEQAVRLIEHGRLACTEIEHLLLEEISEAAGRGDDERRPLLLQLRLLFAHGCPAVHDARRVANKLAVLFGVDVDLGGELARRREDDGARPGGRGGGGREAVEQRQHERERLARARLGHSD